jgi:hypothetical protein
VAERIDIEVVVDSVLYKTGDLINEKKPREFRRRGWEPQRVGSGKNEKRMG